MCFSILGPKIIQTIVDQIVEIPEGAFHLHNLSMKGLTICFSSLNDAQKARYKKLVSFMGGFRQNSLTDEVTHLVTEDIFSKKYTHAALNEMKLMQPGWIDELWRVNQEPNIPEVSALDPPLYKKFKLNIFHKLVVSSTGLNIDEKKKIVKLVQQHGGIYSQTFKSTTVRVLILREKDVGSEKFVVSQRHKIYCLDPQFIFDSVDAGYLLHTENYTVSKKCDLKCSTPTKNSSTAAKFNFDNTILSDIDSSSSLSSVRHMTIEETHRFSDISRSSRTNETKKESTFKKPALPGTKKQASEMPPIVAMPTPKFDYTLDSSDESYIQFLVDKKVCVYGYSDEIESMQMVKTIEQLGATLVDLTYKKKVDYIISSKCSVSPLPTLRCNLVLNDMWVEESIAEGRIIHPPKLYHYAIFNVADKDKVLKGEYFTSTNFEFETRSFIKMVVENLGGTWRDALIRTEEPILFSPTAQGKKYHGAINWQMTVLQAEWLLKCYNQKKRCDESEFLVGDATASRRNIQDDDQENSIIPSSQEIDDNYSENNNNNQFNTPHKSFLAAECNENEARLGNLDVLCEEMPTPQRNLTKSVLLEQQRKNKQISPRSKLLKDLIKTPTAASSSRMHAEYVTSPAPELPHECLLAQIDGSNYGIQPNSSPASQMFYKRKIQLADEDYCHVSASNKKALKEVSQTPPVTLLRKEFYNRRMPQFLLPCEREPELSTQELLIAPYTDDCMSKQADNFLNLSDTQNDQILQEHKLLLEKLAKSVERENERQAKIDRETVRPNCWRQSLVSSTKKRIEYDPDDRSSRIGWKNNDKEEYEAKKLIRDALKNQQINATSLDESIIAAPKDNTEETTAKENTLETAIKDKTAETAAKDHTLETAAKENSFEIASTSSAEANFDIQVHSESSTIDDNKIIFAITSGTSTGVRISN